MLHARFDEMMSEGTAELADLASRRTQLEDEQEKLLRAHYAGAVSLELLKREQDRITASLETIQNRIDAHHGEYTFARANLDDSLTLLSNAGDLYATADDANLGRRGKKLGQARTPTKGGPLVESSNLTHLG
jgi:chromosome segregation ATPase